MTLFSIHKTDADHLQHVIAEMGRLGSPTVRVVDVGDYYQAIEGTHRLAAACITQTPINLEILEADDYVDAASLDWQDLGCDEYQAGDLASAAGRVPDIYEYDDESHLLTQK